MSGVRQLLGPLVLGAAGVAVLASLGFWQVSRLEEKRAVIAEIEASILAAPGALPEEPVPERDRYMPVTAEGVFTGASVEVLASQRGAGTGVHVIGLFETSEGRRVLVDRGFLPDAERTGFDGQQGGTVTVLGNLHWPRDADRYTPEPDLGRGLWFSRAVEPIAAHLESEPVLIVARAESPSPPALRPIPVAVEGIRNDHLEYAITWFTLALVWAGMTAFLMWRIRRETRA